MPKVQFNLTETNDRNLTLLKLERGLSNKKEAIDTALREYFIRHPVTLSSGENGDQ